MGLLRNGDICGGTIVATSTSILVNGRAVAKDGDMVVPHGDRKTPHGKPQILAGGKSSVLVNGIPIATTTSSYATCGHRPSSGSGDTQ